MRSMTPRNAVRVGFTLTSSMTTAAPGMPAAAAAQKAADDGSPGTVMSAAVSARRPRSESRPRSTAMSAPNAASARSV